ncbi:hypothetical protein ABZ897_15765 [Nonomuraea sp. NPDC046802]|uniref:hypothetical protein n=1 Tax=Nonomuraea sp. NPDC046802 TaxID=3154919 RepID=UPI0033C78B79
MTADPTTRELQAEVHRLRAEIETFKAPPEFNNVLHEQRILAGFTQVITEFRDDPVKAAQAVMQGVRAAMWAIEREEAAHANVAQSAIRAMEQMNADRAPATVYLAWGGDYDERDVRKVFLNKADAESYGCADRVEERQVEGGPVETRQWIRAMWTIADPAAPEHLFDMVNPLTFDALDSPMCDYDGKADAFAEDWWVSHTGDGSWVVQFEAWNRDLITAAWKERRDRIVAAHGTLPLPLDQDAPDDADQA